MPNHLQHDGHSYLDALSMLHAHLQPRTYFEIGARQGSSLKIANCATIAVDPVFQIDEDVIGSKPACLLFQMKSDDFFRAHSPAALLGAPVDFAFLDGMHLIEYLLRDFCSVERSCNPDSIIAIHDCLPVDITMTTREYNREASLRSEYPGWWTGDVWKLIPILQKYRPDLTLRGFNAPPTGLLVVSGLAPNDTSLATTLPQIVREFENLRLCEDSLTTLRESLSMHSTNEIGELPQAWR
jgi:hypothetical protein